MVSETREIGTREIPKLVSLGIRRFEASSGSANKKVTSNCFQLGLDYQRNVSDAEKSSRILGSRSR